MNKEQQQAALDEMKEVLDQLMESPMGRRAFLASMGLLMTACASVDKTRYREGDNEGQATDLTVEEERRLTQEALPDMQKDYPKLQDPQLQSYVASLGQNLVRANNLEANPYRYSFSVVDVPYVNAFALPAGVVFITAPLIEMSDTEAELIGVIGHEVGHIQARHTAERMHKAKKAQGKTWLYALGGGIAGAAAGFGLGKLMCSPQDRKCLSKAAELGAVAGIGGGLLIQKYGFMANSREDEMEADRIGFKTALNTGYHRDHVGGFYTKLLQMEQQSKQKNVPILSSVADAMSTHPPSRERVLQMNQMAAAAPLKAQAKVTSAEFDRMKKLASRYAQASKARAASKKQ